MPAGNSDPCGHSGNQADGSSAILQMLYSRSRFLEKEGTSVEVQGQGVHLKQVKQKLYISFLSTFHWQEPRHIPNICYRGCWRIQSWQRIHMPARALLLWKKTRAQFGRTISCVHPNSILSEVDWGIRTELQGREDTCLKKAVLCKTGLMTPLPLQLS